MASRFSVWILHLLFLANLCTRINAANVTSSTHLITSDSGQTLSIAVNVPENGDNDLYFAVSAPPANEWIAWGLGSSMVHSLIFVAYPSADKKNVTVSPRLGRGHYPPDHTSAVNVTVLEGSSYGDNDNYTINVYCSNCRAWPGNSVDITSTSQSMIWAVGNDGSIGSDSLDQSISQHDVGDSNSFTMNFAQATGDGGIPTNTSTNSGSSGDNPGRPELGTAFHALFMVGGFLILLPSGYLALRIFEKVWLHWAIQSVGAFVIIAGSVGGIILAHKNDLGMAHPHTIIGLVVLFLLLATWVMGLLGHLTFRRQKISRTTIPQKSHRFLGPGTMALGLANGIAGFQFAGNNHAIIGYIIICTLMLLIVTALTFMKRRRMQRKAAMTTPAAQNFREGAVEQSFPLETYQNNSYRPDQAMDGSGGQAAPPYNEVGGYYAPPPGRPGM